MITLYHLAVVDELEIGARRYALDGLNEFYPDWCAVLYANGWMGDLICNWLSWSLCINTFEGPLIELKFY